MSYGGGPGRGSRPLVGRRPAASSEVDPAEGWPLRALQSGPGSRPTWSASSDLTRWMVRSASVWRPDWYCAKASRVQRRSRIGAAFTMPSAAARTSRWRPVRRQASTRSSSASSRSSSSLPASVRLGPTTRLLEGPARHRSSPCVQQVGGALGSPNARSSGFGAPPARSAESQRRPQATAADNPAQTSRSRRRLAPCAAARRSLASALWTTVAGRRPRRRQRAGPR